MHTSKSNSSIILNRGDYTTVTINLYGGRVTSWRIQNREQLFVSRIAAFSHLRVLWGGIGISFPHFKEWSCGPEFGFAKNMMWSMETGPHYHENGDVWATFYLKDDYYTQSIWNYNFKLKYTVTLHEFKISFDISVENYNDHFTFDFFLLHQPYFRAPDITNCEITGFKNTLYRVNEKREDRYDEADILDVETRDVIITSGKMDTIFTNVNKTIEINNLIDNGVLKVFSEEFHDCHLWNPWTSYVPYTDTDEYLYLISPRFGSILKPIRLPPKATWTALVIYEINLEKKMLEGVKHFYDYFENYC